MEKLIELLNQCEYDRRGEKQLRGYTGGMFYYIQSCKDYLDLKIISKEYCFIKRLVEKNKIDFDNRELKDKFMEEFERYPRFNSNTYNRDFNINGLLMLLAISDTPIEDLIKYLK